MGLGRLLARTPAPQPPVHGRMLVSNGQQIGSDADLSGGFSWGHARFLRALGIPGVDRSVTLISDLIGGLPWDAYQDRDGGYLAKVTPRPILLEQPNPDETRMSTMSNWVMDYLLHGNAVGVITERDALGQATAVTPVPAYWVRVRRVNGSTYSVFPTGAIEYDIGGIAFGGNDVLHVKGPCEPGRLRGVGALEKHLNGKGSLDLAEELARQAGNIDSSGIPTGVLKATSPDVTLDQLREAKEFWLETQRDRTIAALAPGTDFQPLAWKPEDTQLIEARKLSLLEVANVFGLPPRFLGASSGDSLTYSTAEGEGLDLVKFTVGGHLQRFEQTLSLHFPRDTQVKANLDALLRADTKSRYDAHQVGITAGFLLKSEARALEDLPPVEGIDDEPEPPAAQPDQTPDAGVQPGDNETDQVDEKGQTA